MSEESGVNVIKRQAEHTQERSRHRDTYGRRKEDKNGRNSRVSDQEKTFRRKKGERLKR